MSTKIEPNRNFVAHDEKSKFLIFRPEIPYGGLRNVVAFCFLKYFFERHKNIKKGEGSRVVGKTPKINLTQAFKQSSLCVIRIRIRFNPGRVNVLNREV